MTLHKTAAPLSIHLGTDDQGGGNVQNESESYPQHLPKVFIRAPKGTTSEVIGTGVTAMKMFGSDMFDRDLPFYNHQTKMLETLISEANACTIQRIVSADAGCKANFALYIDVLAKDVDNYKRYSNGDYVIDTVNNTYEVDDTTPTIPGYEVKFILEHQTDCTSGQDIGMLTSKTGTMEDNGTPSMMYPILQGIASEQGSGYNGRGITIESLFNDDLDTEVAEEIRGLIFNLAIVQKETSGSSNTVMRSLFGETSVAMTFNENTKNPRTETRFDFETIFNNQWYNETDPLKEIRYNDFEGIHFYRDQYVEVLNMFMMAERSHITDTPVQWEGDTEPTTSTAEWFDYTTVDQDELLNDIMLMNMFTTRSSTNIPYFTIRVASSSPTLTGNQREVDVTKNNALTLEGGSDGTLDNASYESEIIDIMTRYLDSDDELQNLALHPDSIIYDSGFTLDTKKELANYIALRKDTMIAYSTHDAELGEGYLPLSDERAIAVVLKTRAMLYPESEYYGTKTHRAFVFGGTGVLRDGSSYDRMPTLFEIAKKTAALAGASNGILKSENMFDHGPKTVLTELHKIQPTHIPTGIKATLWNNGMNWVEPVNRVEYFIPAIQSIYEDSTSPVNSWFMNLVICTLNKIAYRIWTQFSGSVTLDDGPFIDAVTTAANSEINGIFDNIVTVIPEVIINDDDVERGYSWQLVYKVYGNVMKTRMTYTTRVFRTSDLEA